MFKNHGGYKVVCDYINWAYTESIDLNAQFKTDSGLDIDAAYTSCNAI